MKPEFKIYKEGKTQDGPIEILSKEDEPFDREAKIQKYLMLGYSVYELDGTEIKSN